MKVRPERVTTAPPRLGVPMVIFSRVGMPSGPVSKPVPRGRDHSSRPLRRSVADRKPQGGSMQGTCSGDIQLGRATP